MDEFDLIQRFFVRENEVPGVSVGIGDDGAVLSPKPGYDLVTVIDTLVEGVHFPKDIDAADLGFRAVAVNLSDIAAMGAMPRWMTLALTLTATDESWLTGFSEGLFAAASEHEVALVGGDTTSGDAVVATVQISGEVEAGKAVLRAGAIAGDTIYVTGTFGDAAAGLSLLQTGKTDNDLVRRYLRPSARVEVGLSLGEFASAAIDVSDGLIGDLAKLLDASGVGAELDLDAIPVSDTLADSFDDAEQRRFALTGGDDYELCFTSSQVVPESIAGVPVTAIGAITDDPGLVCRDSTGIVEIDDSGYRHFA